MPNNTTDTEVSELIINTLTKAQYDELVANNQVVDTELYLTKDEETHTTFEVIYGTTTYAAITGAVTAKQDMVCNYNNYHYVYAGNDGTYYYFTCAINSEIKYVRVNSSNTWGNGTASIPQGTVTSVRVQAGTGLSSSTSTAQTSTLNTTISVASGYKLPTTTEWNGKQDTLPSQTDKEGYFLSTNGSTISWEDANSQDIIFLWNNSNHYELTSNKVYSVSITESMTYDHVDFRLPTFSTTVTKTQNILVHAFFYSTELSISWGTEYFFYNEEPIIEEPGWYDIVYVYNPNKGCWICKLIFAKSIEPYISSNAQGQYINFSSLYTPQVGDIFTLTAQTPGFMEVTTLDDNSQYVYLISDGKYFTSSICTIAKEAHTNNYGQQHNYQCSIGGNSIGGSDSNTGPFGGNNKFTYSDEITYVQSGETYTMTLFDSNNVYPAKIHSFSIVRNNVKILDLYPTVQNNTVGVIDKVSGTFLSNSGTGTLTYGID